MSSEKFHKLIFIVYKIKSTTNKISFLSQLGKIKTTKIWVLYRNFCQQFGELIKILFQSAVNVGVLPAKKSQRVKLFLLYMKNPEVSEEFDFQAWAITKILFGR